MTDLTRIPVAFAGLGPIGAATARLILARDDLCPIVAIDPDPGRSGADLGGYLGGADIGVPIVAGPVPLAPPGTARTAVLIHAVTSRLAEAGPQVRAALDAGWNVMSTCEELVWPYDSPSIAAELDELARADGLSVLACGINPGFLLDVLVLTLTGACSRVSAVEVTRVVDTNNRREPLRAKTGLGMTEWEFRRLADDGAIGHVGLRQSASLVANLLGWNVEAYSESLEPVLAQHDTMTSQGPIGSGKVLGQRQVAILRSGGKAVITYQLEMSVGAADSDSIVVHGEPPIHQCILGGINGDVGTRAIVSNLVTAVSAARPGLLTMADLLSLYCVGQARHQAPAGT